MLRRLAPLVPAVLLAPLAFSIQYVFDFGLAYQGGVLAWSTGRPQGLLTWTATPLLAMVMAVVTRAAPLGLAAHVFMALDLAVLAGLTFTTWTRLRPHVPAVWWWATLGAAAVFAPAVATIFWFQPNIIVFALALGGFVLVGRRNAAAGALIGLSVALKPIVILLPFVLLARKQSRAAGAWAVATAAALTVAGLGFLAWRANDLTLLNPFSYLEGFLAKGQGEIAACVPENYSPVALLCRLGVQPTTAITAVFAAALALLCWLLIRRLPDSAGPTWSVFAVACLMSGMIGPIDWQNYGVLMAPMYLLLAYELWRDHGPARLWTAVILAYVLGQLVWDPLESLAGVPVAVLIFAYTVGQFSQYILLLAWVRWRMLRGALARTADARSLTPSRPGRSARRLDRAS